MKAKMHLWARRALAFLLSFVMAIGGVPAQAFAAESGPDTQFYYKIAVNGVTQQEGVTTDLPTDPQDDYWGDWYGGFLEYWLEEYDGRDNAEISSLSDKSGSSNIQFYKNGRQGTFFTVTAEDDITEDEASIQVTYSYRGGQDHIVPVTVSLTRVLVINSTTATAEDLVYDGNEETKPTVTLKSGETEISKDNYDVAPEDGAKNVGTYEATITPKPLDEQTYQEGIGKLILDYDSWYDDGYVIVEGEPVIDLIPFTVDYDIVPATISGSFDQLEFEENGEGQAPTFTPTGIVDGEDEDDILQYDYASDKADYTDWSADKRSEAGKYAIRVSLKDTDKAKNYVLDPWSVPELEDEDIPEDATTIEVKFEIKPYERELTVDIEGWTYDEYDAEANAPVAQLDGEDLTDDEAALVTYEYKGADEDDDAYTTTVPTKAGDYTVRATFTPFDGATTLTATKDFTVSKRTVKATITVDPDAWYVDEEAPTPTVDAVYNTPTKDTKAFYRKSGDSDWIDWAQNPPTEVGTYEAVAICRKADGTSEYTNVIVESDDPVAFEIKEREQLSVTLDDWVYGEDPKDAETKYGDEVVTADKLEYKAKDAGDDTYDETVPTDAGEYTVRATYYPLGKADDGSYMGDSYTATDDFEITPYEYVVRAVDDEVTYGTTPDLHWSDDEDPLPEGVLPTATLEDAYDEQSGKVGTYAILFKDAEFKKDEEGNYLPATVTYGNYSITYVPGTLTVLPLAEVTVTVKDERIVYGEELPEFQVSQEPEEPVVEATAIVEDAYEESNHDVGTYAIIYEGVELDQNDDGEYIATTIDEDGVLVTYVPGTLTVSPKVINVKPDDQTKVYGEKDPELTYKLFDAETGEETELPEGDELELKIYRDKGEEAAEYAIFFLDQDETYAQAGHEGGNPNNCIIFNFQTGTFTITRRQVTVTPVSSGKKVGEDDPELTADVKGAIKGETVTYTLEREPGEEPDEYEITAKGEDIQGSYEVEYKTGTFVITEDEKTEIIVADDLTKAYGDDDPEFTTTPDSDFKDSLIREEGEDVGEYAITFADMGDVIDDYGTVKYFDEETGVTYYLVPGTLTITPKKVAVTGITAEDKVYDRSKDATLNMDNVVIDGLVPDDQITVTAKGAFEDKDAGEGKTVIISDITLEGEKADNYVLDTAKTPTKTTATISPRPVRVEIDSATKAYGDEDPDFTATVQKAEGDEGQIFGDEIKYNLARTAGEDVGTYSIKNTLNTDQGNYKLTVKRGTLTIEAKKVIVRGITAKDKDYDGTDVAELVFDNAEVVSPVGRDKLTVTAKGTFDSKDVSYEGGEVAQKSVGITDIALEGDKAYNYEVVASTDDGETQTEASAKILPIPVKVSGIEADDKDYDGTTDATLDCSGATFEALIGEDEVTVEDATGEFEDKNVSRDESGAVADKTVNVSEITLGGKDGGNYYADPKEGTQATATAKINPIPVTVTGLKGVSKDYDGNTDAEIDIEGAEIVGLIDADAGKVAVTAATGHFKDANAGSKKSVVVDSVTLAKAEGADEDVSGNYVVSFPEIHAEEADINRLKVTVTADDKTMTYGDAEPELTWTVEPALMEGDTIQATPVREPGDDAGTYEISFANGQKEQGNYEVTFQNGTFTIESREVTVTADDKSMTYGDAEPELTWTASRDPEPAIVNGDQLEVGITREPGKDAGTYEIFFEGAEYQGGKNGTNYHVTYVGGTLRVARRSVTVTGKSQSKVYGNKDPELQATVKGTVNGETVSYEIVREAGEDAHTYPVFVTGKATQGNYNVTFKNGKFTIKRRQVTVKADSFTKTYKAKDPKLTATVTGVDKGETVTYKLKRAKGEDVGTYAIKASGKAVQGNYEVTFEDGSLTIRDKAKLVPEYSAHMMGFGWSPATYDGDFAGTTGQKRRMEALTLKIPGAPYAGGIRYRANVQSKGWMGWKKDGALAGTWGKSLQAEAFQIKLYGELAKHYDVYYRVHVKTKGWMAWAKNGKTAGTIGQSRRCEAIQVVVLRKGSKAPSPNYKGVAQMYNRASE